MSSADELSVTGRDPQRKGNEERKKKEKKKKKRPDDCRQINEESWHLGKDPFNEVDRTTTEPRDGDRAGSDNS